MKYEIIVQKRARKFIEKLPMNEKRRIVEALEALPFVGDIKALKGHKDVFRLRVGDYRVIYTVDDGRFIVYVIDAGSRGQIYQNY